MRVNSCANTLQLNKLPHLGDNVCLPILEGAIRIGEILLSQLVLFTLYFDICHNGGIECQAQMLDSPLSATLAPPMEW